MSSRLATQDSPQTAARTVIGVDLGIKTLLTAAPAGAGPDVSEAFTAGGGIERELYQTLGRTLTRLDELDVDTTTAETRATKAYGALLRQHVQEATAALLEYVEAADADVVAVERLDHNRRPLAECARGASEVDSWLFPVVRDRIEWDLRCAGYRVERVSRKYTTRQCHICGDLATMERATISCTTDDCPVDDVCRDRSAAVTIAGRV